MRFAAVAALEFLEMIILIFILPLLDPEKSPESSDTNRYQSFLHQFRITSASPNSAPPLAVQPTTFQIEPLDLGQYSGLEVVMSDALNLG